MNAPMRIAVYARVSTERQAEQGESVKDQVERIKKWADTNGHTVMRVFEECGASAYEDRRPEFHAMIEWAKQSERPVDAIVVHSMSRFYRDNLKRSICERDLDRHSVKVVSLTQPVPEDQNAAHLFRSIIGAFDEHQSRENAKHVSRCMRANAKQGFFNGSQPPYGFKAISTDIPSRSGFKKRLVVDPVESEYVREIFDLALHGTMGEAMGVKAIATFYNDKGVTKRGRRWTNSGVWDVLHNTVHYGEHASFKVESKTGKKRPKSDWVITKVPAIIDKDKFDLVQEALAARAPDKGERRITNRSGPLTGLLKCGLCNRPMHIKTGKGGRYEYYVCPTRQKSSLKMCKCPNVRKDKVEKAVLDLIAEKVLEPERLKTLVIRLRQMMQRKAKSDQPRLRTVTREISSTEAKLEVLYEQIGSGSIALDKTLEDHLSRLQKRVRVLTEEAASIRQRQKLPLRAFGDNQIEEFSNELRDHLTGDISPRLRPFVRAVLSEAKIRGNNVKVVGSNLEMASAISQYRTGWTPIQVPSHVAEWRARQDSYL